MRDSHWGYNVIFVSLLLRGHNLGETGAQIRLQKCDEYQMLGKPEEEKHKGTDSKADSPTRL